MGESNGGDDMFMRRQAGEGMGVADVFFYLLNIDTPYICVSELHRCALQT